MKFKKSSCESCANYIYDDEDLIIDLLNRDKNGIEKGDNFTFKIEGEYLLLEYEMILK